MIRVLTYPKKLLRLRPRYYIQVGDVTALAEVQ